MRPAQPGDPLRLARMQDPERLMDAEHRGDAREHVEVEGDGAMLAGGPLLRFSPFARPDGAPGIEAGGR